MQRKYSYTLRVLDILLFKWQIMKHHQFMGYKINALPLASLIDGCIERIDNSTEKKSIVFSCANPHALATAESNSVFKNALSDSDLLVTDGVGITIVGRILGKSLNPRITGSDFFSSLMDAKSTLNPRYKKRIYFFGSSEKVLDLLKTNIEKNYPFCEVCGYKSPPYGAWSEEQDVEFVREINDAKPDILWIGMTAPKQEIWTYKNRERLAVPVIGNVGAVFDFWAGTYERAPAWARKLGLEWLVRLYKEPTRMWRRNLISPVVFFISAVKETFFRSKIINSTQLK